MTFSNMQHTLLFLNYEKIARHENYHLHQLTSYHPKISSDIEIKVSYFVVNHYYNTGLNFQKNNKKLSHSVTCNSATFFPTFAPYFKKHYEQHCSHSRKTKRRKINPL